MLRQIYHIAVLLTLILTTILPLTIAACTAGARGG